VTVTVLPRALVTAPFRGPGLDQLRQVVDPVLDPWIEYTPVRLYDADGLAARIDEEGAQVVICEADFCFGPVFERDLLAVGSTRGDPTNVDVAAATAAGVPVLHAPGRNADGVAELAVALALAVTRRVLPADRDLRSREVFTDTLPYQRYRAWQLAGRTVGLVGYGAVGRAAGWRFEGLGMEVLVHDPFATDVEGVTLDELLGRADIVSMHAAVTPDNVAMMGADEFAAMRDGAVYLNTARAALHDLDALTAALDSGKLGGAGLDHFDGEMLAEGHPLTGRDDVILTPHIGGATFDTEANHSALIAADLARLLGGERPIHIANPEVLP
jgi:D-3-phosphoglycerate dehydrogenase